MTTPPKYSPTRLRQCVRLWKGGGKGQELWTEKTLRDQAEKRRQTLRMLNDEIIRLGSERREKGSTLGAAHRVSSVLPTPSRTATRRLSSAWKYIEKKFREALENANFAPETRTVVQRAHAEISAGELLPNRLERQFD